MRIIGSKNNVLDADLLEKLSTSRMSGKVVSEKEVQRALSGARRDLKDEFGGASSVRGLAAAEKAVANTLRLAVDSGWIAKGAAKTAVSQFVDGRGKTSLSATIAKLKEDIGTSGGGSVGYRSAPSRPSRPSSGGYGGGRSTVRYGS